MRTNDAVSLLAGIGMAAILLGAGCTGPCGRIDLGALVTRGRDGWQRPDEVMARLAIEPGERVAEIGAGDGYWLPWLVDAVGPQGRVFAVEVEPAKVDVLRERVEREGWSNVEVLLGALDDPRLPDGTIDLVMTCLTYHHIEGRSDYFARLRTDLAPGGRVVHIDARDDLAVPVRWLPSRGHWSNVDEMDAEMDEAGYARTAVHDVLLMESIRIYAPRAVATPAAVAN